VSERSITQQQAGLVRRAKTSRRNLEVSLGGVLWSQISCPESRWGIKMRKQGVQMAWTGGPRGSGAGIQDFLKPFPAVLYVRT
jgi:hypothetical protein